MSDGRTGTLTSAEVQQLFQSLQSKSIREVALTVCTIRSLASEVKCILRDLFHDDIPAPLPSPRASENSAFGMVGMQPPTTFPRLSNMNSTMPTARTAPPYAPVTHRSTGFSQLLAKRGRRRYKCHHCPRTFSVQASVWRHIRSHHANNSRSSLPDPPSLTPSNSTSTPDQTTNPSASDPPVLELDSLSNEGTSNMFNLPDTSVSTPKDTPLSLDDGMMVAIASPLPSSQPSSPADGQLSPMPTIADMFNADMVKPEPNEEDKDIPVEVNADMDTDSPTKSQEYSADMDASLSMSMLFPPVNNYMSMDSESHIRASVDAKLKEVPADGMYQCSDCGWRSKSSESMRAHMLSHKGILPFSCNICNYKTNKKHVLTRHYTVHTGEKPHKCSICSFGSLDHVELLKHMTKAHPGVHPFTCHICGHHAPTNTMLKKHMKVGHSMSTRKQSSSYKDLSEVHSIPTSSSKQSKQRNVVNSASETIYASATTSVSQPVFP